MYGAISNATRKVSFHNSPDPVSLSNSFIFSCRVGSSASSPPIDNLAVSLFSLFVGIFVPSAFARTPASTAAAASATTLTSFFAAHTVMIVAGRTAAATFAIFAGVSSPSLSAGATMRGQRPAVVSGPAVTAPTSSLSSPSAIVVARVKEDAVVAISNSGSVGSFAHGKVDADALPHQIHPDCLVACALGVLDKYFPYQTFSLQYFKILLDCTYLDPFKSDESKSPRISIRISDQRNPLDRTKTFVLLVKVPFRSFVTNNIKAVEHLYI